jgi:hypothetical protein
MHAALAWNAAALGLDSRMRSAWSAWTRGDALERVVDGGVGLERGQLVHARGVGLERGQLAVEHRHEQLTEDDRVASAPASPAIAVLQGRRVSLLLVLNPKSGRQHFESRFGLEMLLGKVAAV